MFLELRPEPAEIEGCELPLVQPESWTSEGRRWRVVLHCPSCGWSSVQFLDETAVDRLDRELDAGTAQLASTLDYITHINMCDYASRFVAALKADAILPEDF